MSKADNLKMDHGPLKETAVQQYRRLPLLTRVTQKNGQTTYWRSENISEGGIFVRAAPTQQPGTQLEIGFYLPDGDAEIVCAVEVVWCNDANLADFDEDKPYGMGLRFVDLDADVRARIRGYVEQGRVHFG